MGAGVFPLPKIRIVVVPFRRLIPLPAIALFALWSSLLLAAPVAELKPLSGRVIAVDPGHGGEDRGVCYFPSNLIEKEINLDVARRVASRLEAKGARVVFTRDEDAFISLDERAAVANETGADLLLSIHTNRIPGHPECFGAQTFYFPTSEEGKRLAQLLQEELLKVDPENYRSALPGNYRVLRLSQMPGVIVEIGFLTNERDRELIATEAYRDRIAEAILLGVLRYFEGARPGAGAST